MSCEVLVNQLCMTPTVRLRKEQGIAISLRSLIKSLRPGGNIHGSEKIC